MDKIIQEYVDMKLQPFIEALKTIINEAEITDGWGTRINCKWCGMEYDHSYNCPAGIAYDALKENNIEVYD